MYGALKKAWLAFSNISVSKGIQRTNVYKKGYRNGSHFPSPGVPDWGPSTRPRTKSTATGRRRGSGKGVCTGPSLTSRLIAIEFEQKRVQSASERNPTHYPRCR